MTTDNKAALLEEDISGIQKALAKAVNRVNEIKKLLEERKAELEGVKTPKKQKKVK